MKTALIYALEGAGYRLVARLAGLRESRANDVHRAAESPVNEVLVGAEAPRFQRLIVHLSTADIGVSA